MELKKKIVRTLVEEVIAHVEGGRSATPLRHSLERRRAYEFEMDKPGYGSTPGTRKEGAPRVRERPRTSRRPAKRREPEADYQMNFALSVTMRWPQLLVFWPKLGLFMLLTGIP